MRCCFKGSSSKNRSPSPERPLTPRRQFIRQTIKELSTDRVAKVTSEELTIKEKYLNRARNSHNAFCEYYDIAPQDAHLTAFPRVHEWTRELALSSNAEDLIDRIWDSFNTPQEELFKIKQEYIGQKSLKFLLDSGIMPKKTDVIADLFCETGGFLVAMDNAKSAGEIEYDTAYGIDIDSVIEEIAERWKIPHIIHRKNITEERNNTIQKADFIYMSAPPIKFENEQQANDIFKGIHQYAKNDSKLFFGLSCSVMNIILNKSYSITQTLTNAMGQYFDYDLITAKDAEEKGWCEKDRLIADTYGGCFILTPKKQEVSPPHSPQQASSSTSKETFGGMKREFF